MDQDSNTTPVTDNSGAPTTNPGPAPTAPANSATPANPATTNPDDVAGTASPAATSDPSTQDTASTKDAKDTEDTGDATSATDAPAPNPEIQAEVVKKISEAQNVLVALSADPSVDEMAAAIGLSIYLDKLGKRATAIYSGATPNALEFLKPEETFEPTTDALQDFVIALNKEKADHLRYKLDGDYVKIFITPYKTRIGEEDLEFSYGDFNVDLVLALNVTNGVDLDSALREHGRIMHDAVIVNITTNDPGRFGEIEWSDKAASSVSEMIANLLYSVDSKIEISKEEATAFLTGIVAATDRFSNTKTTPETMRISSQLMQSGADQQLISKNITSDMEDELYSIADNSSKYNNDPTVLDIEHEHVDHLEEGNSTAEDTADIETTEDTKDISTTEQSNEDELPKEIDAPISEPESNPASNPDTELNTSSTLDNALLDDLKAAEASLASAGNETVPDTSNQPVRLEDISANNNTETPESSMSSMPPVMPSPEPGMGTDTLPTPAEEGTSGIGLIENDKPEKVIQPPSTAEINSSENSLENYGKMLQDAIAEPGGTPADQFATPSANPVDANPASMMAPPVASAPEINGVPEINYMPMPGEEVLPPPPTPPIDMTTPAPEAPVASAEPVMATAPVSTEPIANPNFSSTPVTSAEPTAPIQPAIPPVDPTSTPLGSQPVAQNPAFAPQASDPSAFRIPGM